MKRKFYRIFHKSFEAGRLFELAVVSAFCFVSIFKFELRNSASARYFFEEV
jgi:hypothetical protein